MTETWEKDVDGNDYDDGTANKGENVEVDLTEQTNGSYSSKSLATRERIISGWEEYILEGQVNSETIKDLGEATMVG